MGRVEGKVALITGAARGQGRSHALRLAEEGADIIALDICQDIGSAPYAMATQEDLAETVRLVEDLDRRIVARQADVRDREAVEAAVRDGVAEFGHLDIVCANAGIVSVSATADLDEQTWADMIDINLTGVWRTVSVALPHMLRLGTGGSIILTSSVQGVRGIPGLPHYTAAKHGVIGLTRSWANELGPSSIRVNAILPGNVGTPMILNDALYGLFRPDLEQPTQEDFKPVSQELHALPIPWLEPSDISNAVLFLASDEARYMTGTLMAVDAGMAGK